MTKINRLVMHGFKSFAKRTTLEFGTEFNCVLGPNGSGKSNILDALCFVLGKSSAKALRSEKSANLIYNGGKSKNPSKQAEVSVFFDNTEKTFPTDSKEVKISRIVKPNGQSSYYINDEKRTRTQIMELLGFARINSDGYNIILQGDIIRFVEMATEERRLLIEDIAGIGVYEEKKQKALLELNKVAEKLTECGIVLAERNISLKELKKEKEQAEKHKDLHDRIKINKASVLHKQIKGKSKQNEDLERIMSKVKEQLGTKQKDLAENKSKINDARNQIKSINEEIEQKGERDQVQIHKQVEQLKVDIASSKNRVESISTELVKIKNRKSQIDANANDVRTRIKTSGVERDEYRKQIDARKNEITLIDQKVEEFKKKNNLESASGIEKEIDQIDRKIEKQEQGIAKVRIEQQDLLREKDRVEFQIESIDEKISKVLEAENENKEQLQQLKQMRLEFKKATLELTKCLNNDSELAAQLANSRKKNATIQEELAKLNARNISIQENLGADLALKEIIKAKTRIHGIQGTIAELGSVSAKYSLALEIAAGSKIKSVVVQDDKVASQCITYLKENKLGIATFLPLNKIRAPARKPEIAKLKDANGCHGLAIDLVDFDPKHKAAFQHVFGNTLVIDTINVARRIGIGVAKMVTLDGDMADLSGAMQGGYRKRKRQGLGFSEREVQKNLEKQEGLAAETAALTSRLEHDRSENEERIVTLREFKANIEGDIIKIEKVLHIDSSDVDINKETKKSLRENLKNLDKKIDNVVSRISDINRDAASLKIKKQQLRQKVNELRNPKLIAQLNAYDEKKRDLREQVIKRESDLQNIENQIKTILKPELENSQKIVRQHEKEDQDFREEQKLLDERITTMGVNLKEKEQQQAEFHKKFRKLFDERNKLDLQMRKWEKKVDEIGDNHRKIEVRLNTTQLEAAKIRTELGAIEHEYKQYEGVKIIENKSEGEMRKEAGIWEGILTRMGTVNMRSLDIYDIAEKEYQILLGKKEKLDLEKEDIHVLMNEIETKKKDLFMKTYKIVNDHFKVIFSALSTKGNAGLVLENPDDPFAGGVLIKVKLSGTKYMDIRSLSGGEKTMTALAFIFAIQEHDPASFYIMDEVDAALDKKNSDRLAQLIRKYTDRAQYVVITHNDRIINEADILYGVSMNEHGVSQVTTLQL